ncbi:MAG: Hsp70 family protein [Deltaproteobacteria bacterium]|nr:Hsp70 family protein [Deltaproteobacteria bacterium]
MRVGIDFGTSNSTVAVIGDDGLVRLARFHHALTDADTDTTPTVLFFPGYERDVHFGHAAVSRYLFTGLEGRFIQSMKAFLPAQSFTGTLIRGQKYEIEDLVTVFLRRLIAATEETLGVKIEGDLVVGRPARFSLEPDKDALAESRLRRAVGAAGLSTFRFLIEPVAAALAYESTLERDQTVLIADLGGGTSDFTVMRVGPSQRPLGDRRPSILASGGLPIAGDKLDGELVRTALLERLGAGSDYLAFTDRAPVPSWIFQRLLQWNHVSFLKSKDMLEFLRRVHRDSSAPDAIGRLLRIVEEDQGYLLFRAVERAKRALADQETARIADEEHGLAIDAEITRPQADAAMAPLVERIFATAEETLAAAEVEPDAVDAVFMTGGTSLLPAIRRRFEALFGTERIQGGRTFTSVAVGLALGAGARFSA